jgi:hypothetical protein
VDILKKHGLNANAVPNCWSEAHCNWGRW